MIEKTVDQLLLYATLNLGKKDKDIPLMRTKIFRLLSIKKPYEGKFNRTEILNLKTPDVLYKSLVSDIKEKLLKDDIDANLIATEVFGILSPSQKEVDKILISKMKSSKENGLDYLYDLSINNYYIRKSDVDRNIKWSAKYSEGEIEITINVSKPEKNNKDIAKLKDIKENVESSFPKCMLCKENIAYKGRRDYPSKSNLRVINLKLDDKDWFIQYSPYVYYNHHLICINKNHIPMEISEENTRKMFAFVDMFPHYFIGSNSDLPIVGGSILNHEHFQGGLYDMPMMKVSDKFVLTNNRFKNTTISVLNWRANTFLLKSKNKKELLDAFSHFEKVWRDYDDREVNLLSKSDKQHSTLTLILRKIDKTYYLYIILRNNRQDKEHPDGIFHVRNSLHHIKSEGIGLIEAMGLFILPGRLESQLDSVQKVLDNKLSIDEMIGIDSRMKSFIPMIKELRLLKRPSVKTYVSKACHDILSDIAIFKDDENGRKALERFILKLNLNNTLSKNEKFKNAFGYQPTKSLFCSGRIEIIGNHLDHNNGVCLVSGCSLGIDALYKPRQDKIIRIFSDGFKYMSLDISDVKYNKSEIGTSISLVKGIIYKLEKLGYKLNGFDAYLESNIFAGAGVSSSAAFEVLIAKLLLESSGYKNIDKLEIAKVGQFAENQYFGKPCGLLDQIGVSFSGLNFVDFKNPLKPKVENIGFPFKDLSIVLVNSGGSHDDLTDLYGEIPSDMFTVARFFKKKTMREISKSEFDLNKKYFNERMQNRAFHYFNEYERVLKAKEALIKKDKQTFLSMINESGLSSSNLLKNTYVEGEYKNSPEEALSRARKLLKNGACRINGGGFKGTILCFVPNKDLSIFVKKMIEYYGSSNVCKISIPKNES